METSSTIQHQLSEEKWSQFKEDIKNVEEISKKIENFFIIDYEAIFPEILLISKNQFLSNIKKGVYSTLEDLYTDNIKFDKTLQSLVDDNLKKIEEKYEINYKLLKKEWTNYSKNKNDINYLCNYRKHCFNDSDYASHNCNNNISKFIVISINIDNNENEFVICSNCQKIYKSSFIQCKCFYCDIEYYSQKLPEDQNTELFLATWKDYHCPQLINNKMSCIKCKSPFYLNLKTGMLNCINKDCQFVSKPNRILWTCNNCKKDFTSEAIVYNPLDVEIIQKVIKQTLLLKHRAHPNKIPCCKLNIFFTEFYHKKTCKGILYLGEINDELIIVCEKCHAINYYARFIWTCPKCQTKFRTKKKEVTQSDYNSHKSDEFSNDKIISLKEIELEKENKNDIQNNQIEDKKDESENEIKVNTKDNNDNNFNDYKNKVNYNKNECQEIKEQKSDNKEIEVKDKEDDVVNVIRKNSLKAVVASPIRNKYRNSYQSFRNRRHNRLNTEINKPLNLVSMENKDSTDVVPFGGNDNNENKYQRKSMNVFNRKYKRGIADFRIGQNKEKEKEKEKEEDNEKKKEEEEDKDTNEGKKKDENIGNEDKNKNDVKQNNENNNYYKSNYRNRYKKKFDKNRNKKEDNKDSNTNNNENKIDENKGDNKYNKASENDNDNNDESKLMRTNTTNERNFIDRRRSVFMHYRHLRLQNLEKKENQTEDENKNNQIKTENNEKENPPEKVGKFRTRGAFSKYLFLGSANNNLGGSSKNNFLERNLLRRASLQVPYNSGLRARFNKKENSRKSSSSSSSSSSFSDKIDNIKYNPKIKQNINSFKDKDTNSFKDKDTNSFKDKNGSSLKSKKEDSLKDKNEDSPKNKNKDSLKHKNENSPNDKEKDKVKKNIIKNIKENSKKSTKVSSKESDKENSKKLFEKSQEKKKEEVKEDDEEQEEEEDDFDDDNEEEDQTKGIEVNNNKNDDTNNNTSNTQYIQSIPGISDHLLAHITKRINHILSNTKISQFNLEDYSIYRKLGEGSYGIIHCIIHEKTKEKFALKKIIAHSLKKIAEFTKEFELVHICHHPNILKIYGLNINILDQSTYSLQVLMEKAERDWDKDIKRRLQERRYYTENELISIMRQLTSALLFMKEKLNITHRDIKPQNVLIFNDGIFKLADFGEAKEIKVMKNLNTLRGTELYMSPALYNGLKVNQDDVAHDPFKSDLFSLGFCLVYAATFNFNLLYELRNINNDELIKKKIREQLKDNYSEKFIWILTKMVELEEKNRFDFKQLADEIDKNYGK